MVRMVRAMMNIYLNRAELCLETDLDGNDITGISSIPPTDSSIVSKKYVKDNYVNSSGGTGYES